MSSAKTNNGKKQTNAKKGTASTAKRKQSAPKKTSVKTSVKSEPVKKAVKNKNTEESLKQSRATREVVRERRVLSKEEQAVKNEIILTITALVSVLLYLSYFNIGGKVGVFFSSLLFGTMGAFAYAFPIVLFFFVAFYLSNHGNRVAYRKSISGIAFLFLLTALLQLIFGIDEKRSIIDYYTYCANTKTGGGIFGAVIAVPFNNAFGKIATYCIIVAFMIVFLMLLTGKAIFSLIKRKSKEQIEISKARLEERNKYFEELEKEEIEENLERRAMQYVTLDNNGTVAKPAEEHKKESFLDSLKNLGNSSRAEVKELFHDNAESNSTLITDTEESRIFSEDYLKLKEKSERLDKDGNVIPNSKTAKMSSEDSKRALDSFPKYTLSGTFKEDVQTTTAADMQEINAHAAKPVKTETLNIPEVKPAQEKTTKPAVKPVQKPAQQTETEADTVSAGDEQNNKPATEKVKLDAATAESTAAEINASLQAPVEPPKQYVLPPLDLLNPGKGSNGTISRREIEKNADTLTRTLESFGVHVKLLNVSCGPTVTRYELQPEQGVKVSSITKLENDIKLNLAASDIRIEAPIPGKAAIGIEVPNKENSTVCIRDMLECTEFKTQNSGITFAVGKDITGDCIVTDISKMPHLLIAGATGSGKSVCINTLVMSILYKYKPTEIRLIMIDPKMVELGVYNGIPHLLIPVVTDPKKAAASLNWAVQEMTNRYEKFAEAHVRDLKGYNKYVEERKKEIESDPKKKAEFFEHPENLQPMPKIVIIVDELADLMMVAPGEVENAIIRLSQLARAAGMHLVIATQRPSVNVITGLIKANMPSRIALAVTSSIDSRTILDQGGAEKLLGKGDMLFAPMNLPKPIRVQGAFVSDGEVERVVEFIKEENSTAVYSEEIASKINSMTISGGKNVSNQPDTSDAQGSADGLDEYLIESGRLIIDKQKASIGMLQRVYRIGFNRAARIVDQLSDFGVLGPENGTKSREILMTKEQFEEYVNNNLK